MSDDPFAPSTDPDIPTPTREDLLRLVHGSVRDHLAAGTLDARHAANEWTGARRQWNEGHKRDAEHRRLVEDPIRKVLEQRRESEADFRQSMDHLQEHPPTGIRVPVQQRSRTPAEERDDRLRTFMPEQLRAEYDAADFERREIIWAANERAYNEAEARKERRLKREEERMAKILDTLQRVKEDPTKAHLLPAPDADLHEWYETVSKPIRTVPFPGNIDAGARSHSESIKGKPARRKKVKTNKPDSRRLRDEGGQPNNESIIAGNKRVSWIHRIPVWKEFGHWLKWASACFAFAVAMTQVNEYAWALAGLVVCGICCFAQIHVWTASPNRLKNRVTKLLFAIISLTMITISGLTVVRIKGDKPLSNLIPGNQPTLPKPVSSTESKLLPRFNHFMLEPRPIHDGGYLIYKAVHPADLSPIEFYARLGELNGEDIRVVVYVVRPYQTEVVLTTIVQNYETIVEQLKAQAKEKGFLDIAVSRTVVVHVDLGGGEPISFPKEARQKGINFEIERRLL